MSIITGGGIFGLDYKEGVWTAGVSDTSGNDSSTTASGSYVKIGSLVHISFLGFNNISTAGLTSTDGVRVTGLPFSVKSGFLGGSVVLDKFDLGSAAYVTPVPVTNGTEIVFRTTISGASDNQLLISTITSGTSDITYLSVTYLTD